MAGTRISRLTSLRHAGRRAGSFAGRSSSTWTLLPGTFTLTGISIDMTAAGDHPVGRLTRQTSSAVGGRRAASFSGRQFYSWVLQSGSFALTGRTLEWTSVTNQVWDLLPGNFSLVGRTLEWNAGTNNQSWVLQSGSFALYGRPISIESQAVSPQLPATPAGSKTYLQICRETRSSVGEAGDGPATVVNQVGMLGKIVGWVADGYTELQAEPRKWCWLSREVTLQLQTDRDRYVPGLAPWDSTVNSRIYAFDPNNCVLWASDGSYNKMSVLTWERFNDRFPVTTDLQGRPSAVAFAPWGEVHFDRKPDQAYTLSVGVNLRPQLLTADADIPDMPFEFHSYLVKLATIKYALQRGDTTLYQMTEAERRKQHRNLILRCTQPVTMGPVPAA